MSTPIFPGDLLFIQRLLASAGLYHGALDGRFGPKTEAAEAAFAALTTAAAAQLGTFDARTEVVIATLLPKAQIAARKFMKVAATAPFTVKLISGTRTYAEQNALFSKRPKVTNARGGQSNHNFGIAWDVGIFVNGVYYEGRNVTEERAYSDLAALIKRASLGLEWGGDWQTFKDAPHYQLATGKSVSECRALLEQGKPYA